MESIDKEELAGVGIIDGGCSSDEASPYIIANRERNFPTHRVLKLMCIKVEDIVATERI